MLVPQERALLGIVEPLAAMMKQHVQGDVFAHPHGEIGIDDPYDRDIWQRRIAEKVVDAGAERENRARNGKPGEQPARRLPGTDVGDFGGIADPLRPDPEIAARAQVLASDFPIRPDQARSRQ